jgi:type IV pilus assembly protein PilY1
MDTMNAQSQRTKWTSAGLLLAMVVGSPVISLADDTELLLVTPDTGSKPNILFILDTSGSMADEVMTQEPYDASAIYAGDCDTDAVYWTDVDVTPDCAGSSRFVAKTSFVCQAAAGQLMGIGSYSDTMVQYRETAVAGVSRWQELEPGVNGGMVECQADSGEHGDGTAGDLWAFNGAGGSAFTNDSDLELAWGSAPAAVTYSVYDGNYLNWKESPATASLQKIDILKAVTTAVLNSIDNVNVGVMRFNNNQGGPVIKAISDIDQDRQDILDTIDSLNADGATPLSETLYESALYWRGMNAHYGENVNQHPTDPEALDSISPENYRQPSTNVCSKNFNVLLSDGMPNNDDDTPGLVGNLPGYGSGCDGSGLGLCLDDIARYLSQVDIDTTMGGDQFVTTHTIGFDIDLPILRDTAAVSGGRYFLADDVESLALALLDIIADITSRSLSFSAPAVSVNTFNRTQNLNDLYLTVFSSRTNVHWPGNLKKYQIEDGEIIDANGLGAVNPATGFFFDDALSIWTAGNPDGNVVTDGGAAHQLPVPASRNLYTNNGSSSNLAAAGNAIHLGNADAFQLADFGMTGATGEPSKDEMIRWMRGEDIRNEDFDPSTSVRNVMGDPLHSQPAAVVYGGDADAPEIVVFLGTNDGYLHAIDGTTGEELWAFVPNELLGDMNRLFFDSKSNFKHYGIDGSIVPVVNDENNNAVIEPGDGDFVYLVFGLRRGGNSFYALDVTNRNAPNLLWNVEYPEFGQSWSTPAIARMNIDDPQLNDERAVVVIGGGYDPVHDTRAHPAAADAQGAGIHILDLESGARLWRVGRDGGADLQLPSMTRSIPTQVRVLDINGDGLADRMYASDMGGQLWRFDVSNGEAPGSLVAGGVIAQLGAEGLGSPTDADTRRFYNSPDVSIFNDPLQGRRFIAISIGSGYRAHPLDNNISDRFFSIRDPDIFNRLSQADYDAYDVVTDGDLAEISGQVRVVLDSDDRGWKFTMPGDQKVITNSITFNDSVFFVGFSPEANLVDMCQPSNGRNFLYQVSIVNGDPVVNNLDAVLPEDADAERVTELAQGGIAPTPTFLFPSPTDPDCAGAQCAPPPIGCVGVECFDPGFVNNPVRTLWTQEGIE